MEVYHGLFFSLKDKEAKLVSGLLGVSIYFLFMGGEDDQNKFYYIFLGYALAWEFLRNIGIDGTKPDLHMRRILGNDRLGYSDYDVATEIEVITIFDSISKNTGCLKSYLDIALWSYCADGYGEICTASPKCKLCVIREFCNYKS